MIKRDSPADIYLRVAFQREGIHRDLYGCINRVYLRGCEAAYLGNLVDTSNYCNRSRTNVRPSDVHEKGASTCKNNVQEDEPIRNSVSRLDDTNEVGESGMGSLVVHIRSGDIFHKHNDSRISFGQVSYATTH